MDDQKTQINITVPINPRFIERVIYWIIIIVLAVLLILAYLKDCSGTPAAAQNTTQNTQVQAPTPTPPPAQTPAADAATCTDGKKNQDETDVDCGGSKCSACTAGKACSANSDCNSNNCVSHVCTNTAAPNPATVTGAVTLQLSAIQTQADPSNNTYHKYKVTSATYTIKNGLSGDLKAHAKIFIKDKSSAMCLLQLTVDDATNCAKPYAEFDIPVLASGASRTDTASLSGTYVYQIVGNSYDPTDPQKNKFNVVMYLYDQDGNAIGGKTISDSYTFTPR